MKNGVLITLLTVMHSLSNAAAPAAAGSSASGLMAKIMGYWHGLSPMYQKALLLLLGAAVAYWLYSMACCKGSSCSCGCGCDKANCDAGRCNCPGCDCK